MLVLNVPLVALASLVFILAMLQPDQGSRDLVDPTLEPNQAAQALMSMPEEERAKLVARESAQLLREPLDLEALSNLAVLKSVSGDQKNADAIVLEAARRSLRDTQTQVAAIRQFIASNDLEKAMFHIDGLLTANPVLATSLFPALLALPDRDKTADALAGVLTRNPPWRGQFMNWLSQTDRSGLMAYKLFTRLRKRNARVGDHELRSYIGYQFNFNNHGRAYFVWLDELSDADLKKVGLVFDGGFDLQPRNLYFDWKIDPFPNADIGVAARPDEVENHSLRVSFSSSTKPFHHVYQFLRLPAGQYSFKGEWMATGLRTPAGLAWRVNCVESRQQLLQTSSFAQSAPWSGFASDFEVPAKACDTQTLRLVTASNAVLDAAIDGELRFDNLNISVAASPATESKTEQP